MRNHSFLRHAAVYAVGEILGLAGAFLLLPLYTRRLTPGEFGSLEMGERVNEFLTLCILARGVTLAFFVFYKQSKSEAERRRVVGSVLLLITVALLLGGTTMLLAAPLLSAGLGLDNPLVLQVYALVGLLDMFVSLGLGVCQARQESVPFVLVSLAQFGLRVGLCILFVVVLAWGIQGVLLASLLRSAFFACVLTAREVRRGISWPDRRLALDMIHFALPFLAGGLCGIILNNGDRFFLLRCNGPAAVGVYGIGYRLALVVNIFSLAPLYRVWSARMYDVAERGDAPVVFGQVFTRILAAYLGVGLALCLFQDEIVITFAGADYASAAPLLAPVVLAYWFQSAAVLMDAAFYVRRRTGVKLGITLAATAVMVLLYALLIPPYGGVGAALATLGGFAFLAGLTGLVAQRLFPVRYEAGRLVAMLVSAVALWFGSRMLPAVVWAIPIKLALWGLWPLGLWVVGAVTAEEKQWAAAGMAAILRKVSALRAPPNPAGGCGGSIAARRSPARGSEDSTPGFIRNKARGGVFGTPGGGWRGTTMPTPLVSVIIPTHNGAAWLPECLASVLRQTYDRREILVIDDDSTDATPAVLRALRPGYVCSVSRAAASVRPATTASDALGDYLAFLDHDDLWKEDKLDKQVRHVLAHPEIDVLYTDAEEFDEQGTVHESFFALFPGLRRCGDLFSEIVRFAVPLMSTTLFKAAFLRCHELTFPERVSGVDDVGLFLEIAARGGVFGHLDKCLVARRLHAHNLSKNHYNRFAQRAVLYADLLERLKDAPPAHRTALLWGLRDARFRLGECAWADLQLREARLQFRAAIGLDAVGRRALRAYLLSLLPVAVVRGLRAAKVAAAHRHGPLPAAAR